MATFNSNEVLKKLRNRGSHAGRVETVSGVLRVEDGDSIATTDLINMLAMGENTRPIALTLAALPVSGTPSLTNPTFDIGVKDIAGTFTRPDGSTFAAVTTDADKLSAALALTTDNVATDSDLDRPMATAAYAPYYITVTPSGAGAFSVSGGDIDLVLTVSFVGEVKGDAAVYTEYMNDKVNN
jgi:hypothetical protein